MGVGIHPIKGKRFFKLNMSRNFAKVSYNKPNWTEECFFPIKIWCPSCLGWHRVVQKTYSHGAMKEVKTPLYCEGCRLNLTIRGTSKVLFAVRDVYQNYNVEQGKSTTEVASVVNTWSQS
jgi:hypothetical protein